MIRFHQDDCYLLSHQAKLNNIYWAVDENSQKMAFTAQPDLDSMDNLKPFKINTDLFGINTSYVRDQQNQQTTDLEAKEVHPGTEIQIGPRKRRRQKTESSQDQAWKDAQELIRTVEDKFQNFRKAVIADNASSDPTSAADANNNAAIALAKSIQDDEPAPFNFRGENNLYHSVLHRIAGSTYVIPPRCEFFQNDVRNIEKLLADAQRGGDSFFDLVVIDPPWWNRYVRRAKQAKPSAGYQMLDGAAIRDIPLERYVRAGSVVAIWCTNGPSHVAHLKDELLPKWNLKLISTWYWVKVTRRGRTVCEFRDPLQKQPFERLFVACHADSDMKLFESLRETRYLFSVPSSIHSHKPPVIDLFQHLFPIIPKCLEIFARYLLPNFTSIGFEVLKMQNRKLFVAVDDDSDDEATFK